MDAIHLVGLDFGTTTSSAVMVSARLLRNSVTGRVEVSGLQEIFRSDLVFTPLFANQLDVDRIAKLLDGWLASGGVRPENIFGGGALLTGLTARKDNTAALVDLVRGRLGDALIARAEDPCLESWLAFMGSCRELSRAHPQTWFLNLDIGGGTTNLALGKNGEVHRTGCLFVGARHIEVVPGTYRIVKMSSHARRLLDQLGITKSCGDELTAREVNAVMDFYSNLLEAVVAGRAEVFADPVAQLHQQVPLVRGAFAPVIVTLSGGVGELVYAAIEGKPLPSTTYFGDLGIDFARRLLESSPWTQDFRQYRPAGGGRATVYGLMRHSTQVSGTTIYLADATVLPLRDVPILGTITNTSADDEVRPLLDLVRKSPQGGCIQVRLEECGSGTVQAVGGQISRILEEQGFPAGHPLVVLVADNVGKALGQYITRWGAWPLTLIVIDEIAVRDAQYVHVGALKNQVMPISFYGLKE